MEHQHLIHSLFEPLKTRYRRQFMMPRYLAQMFKNTRWRLLLLLYLCCGAPQSAQSATEAAGPQQVTKSPPSQRVAISYQLPADGPLPKTYMVTLAAVDAKNPDWIVSTFVAGQPRTVTSENGGKFTETWDGLDENFMPVPPGIYGVKGIFAAAQKWEVDGEWHAITPRYAAGASPFLPAPGNGKAAVPFGGDPIGKPLRDVDVGANGIATFLYQYLENGTNLPQFDLNKPVGPDQFVRAHPSGGAAGGTSVATDGANVWAYSTDGGPKFVFRGDRKSFGKSPGANRIDCYLPEGWVTALAAATNEEGKDTVFVAQRGKFVKNGPRYTESHQEFADIVTCHEGNGGEVLARMPLPRPQGLVVRAGRLFALHAAPGGWAVSSVTLVQGRPQGSWRVEWNVPREITPYDVEMDASGRFYLSDRGRNKVFQLDGSGKIKRQFGRMDVQLPGRYDPETLMAPEKLATWRDKNGKDRLIVVEGGGPNRASEWSADDGSFVREYGSYLTKANDGYAVDPADASQFYVPGQDGWLCRFQVDYATGSWKLNAVWPNVPTGRSGGIDKPVLIRANQNLYLAGEKYLSVYRLDKVNGHFVPSASHISRDGRSYFWHDANNNGAVDDAELRPANLPGQVITYHGQKWLPDLSYVAPAQGGKDVWRLAPSGFDAYGNPIFQAWQKLFTDPVFVARSGGHASALYGGNELAESFSSDWMQVDGSLEKGFFVQARGGPSFSANFGAQYKISRYVPGPEDTYRLKWRVGRAALSGKAARGETTGAMRLFQPINGILAVVDQSRSGVLLYTEDGLYVDTLFPDPSIRDAGIYEQPGEFFAGTIFPNRQNGKIYYGSGKYTPLLYEMSGWSLRESPVQRLETLSKTLSLASATIASPPEIAVSVRGGAGSAKVARFAPAIGGVATDGSMLGWENVEPVVFGSGAQQVEVRPMYQPDALWLRWHVKLGQPLRRVPSPPAERIFSHDSQGNTVSLYFQGDAAAPAPANAAGRPGDARFVFGLFQDGAALKPMGVAFYPHFEGANAKPQTYRTPVGEARFEHVTQLPVDLCSSSLDADGKGFVLVTQIPRSAIPMTHSPFAGGLRTYANFDANLGGHHKFWWANSDGSASQDTYDEPSEARLYPGSWAPVVFQGLDTGITVRQWKIVGPFGGPGTERFNADPQREQKEAVRRFLDQKSYPPDANLDLDASYGGNLVKGWWQDPGTIRWKSATVTGLDTRVRLGAGAQVWYGATWVYSPSATEVDAGFHSHPQTYLRWTVNGTELPIKEGEYLGPAQSLTRTATRKLALKAGWNAVVFRGFCVGFPPFSAGLTLLGPPETLWKIRLASSPPPSP